ncbi:hypothetical protein V6N13_002020 [Hibiscus sabdariffa]|uniref:Pentatricopeptide repeat-containing protein n=1 Tax=Hibiscus sabdariffa TaxID=183260 RepID=A0ABR2C1L9_9ROSI
MMGDREVPFGEVKKLMGKEALFVILGLKRFKDDEDKLQKFIKTHVLRLLKMDLIAVLSEFERQEETSLAAKVSEVIKKQDWYKPDVFLYKDLIIALAKCRKMDEAMKLWETMRKENLFPDSHIRGFLRDGSPADAMNISRSTGGVAIQDFTKRASLTPSFKCLAAWIFIHHVLYPLEKHPYWSPVQRFNSLRVVCVIKEFSYLRM